jgi:hypothetical protein
MQASTRRTLSMAVRALNFARANPSTDASHQAVVARLEERLAGADALALQERDGKFGERDATARRMALRKSMQQELLRHLVRTVQAAGKANPAIPAGDFALPDSSGANRAFATDARAMLAAALPLREALLPYGLGETTLDDLGRALAEFEALTEAAHLGRRQHVDGRAALNAIAGECAEEVRLLDGFNRKRFKGQPGLLAAWMSARNVVGPFTPAEVEEAAPSVPPPATSGEGTEVAA